jgi:hypothetical protein
LQTCLSKAVQPGILEGAISRASQPQPCNVNLHATHAAAAAAALVAAAACTQAKLNAEQLAELPVPLLAEHAATLGAPRSRTQQQQLPTS